VTALQGGLVIAKCKGLELRDNIYGQRSILTTATYLASKEMEIGEKRKLKAITLLKVIEVGTNRKPVCEVLLVINSN